MSANKLLSEIRQICHQRPDRVLLTKEFEQRIWKKGKRYSEYVHEKIIPANLVPTEESVRIDFLVDGIPEITLRHQARIL